MADGSHVADKADLSGAFAYSFTILLVLRATKVPSRLKYTVADQAGGKLFCAWDERLPDTFCHRSTPVAAASTVQAGPTTRIWAETHQAAPVCTLNIEHLREPQVCQQRRQRIAGAHLQPSPLVCNPPRRIQLPTRLLEATEDYVWSSSDQPVELPCLK